VGAYRLGITKELIQQSGIEGLYSRSLFNYDSAFLNSMDDSIEVGRSVVAPAYQRQLQPLLLLWKGIAHFVAKNPKYTHLFGPVSISNDYSPVARQLIASVMTVTHYDNEKAKLVQPTTPLAPSNNTFWQSDMLSSLGDVGLFSKVLSRLEKGPGIPILLKQYLGLNGKLVCFNVDPAFNDALDGLIVVNLAQVDKRTLGKYMGKENAQRYIQRHQH
jgi:putative hemolysin